MQEFQHSGDLGDIIAALASVKHLGGGSLRLVDRPYTKALIPRVPLIEDLLRTQSYVSDVVVGDPHGGHEDTKKVRDFSTFRSGGLPWGVTLGALQAKWVGIAPERVAWSLPWLHADPAPGYSNATVFARSPRYNNHTFPWAKIAEHLDGESVFLGLPEEHAAFCKEVRRTVPRIETRDMWEVATIIKGCRLFIGNQSCPFNIAEALKVPRILECCTWTPDCCYGGGDVQYVADGALTLRNSSGKEATFPSWLPQPELNTEVTPPGGWVFTLPDGSKVTGIAFNQAKLLTKQAFLARGSQPPADIGAELIRQTIARLPDNGLPRWYATQREQWDRIHNLCKNTCSSSTTGSATTGENSASSLASAPIVAIH